MWLKQTNKNHKRAAGREVGVEMGGQGMRAKAAAETRPRRCSGHLQVRLPGACPESPQRPTLDSGAGWQDWIPWAVRSTEGSPSTQLFRPKTPGSSGVPLCPPDPAHQQVFLLCTSGLHQLG